MLNLRLFVKEADCTILQSQIVILKNSCLLLIKERCCFSAEYLVEGLIWISLVGKVNVDVFDH